MGNKLTKKKPCGRGRCVKLENKSIATGRAKIDMGKFVKGKPKV